MDRHGGTASHYVKQRHDRGCAIATIAMVTGTSYHEVLDKAFPSGFRRLREPGRAYDIGVTPRKAVQLIQSYGIKARLTLRRRVLKNTSIMFFDWFPDHDQVVGYHSVVWLPRHGKILDPGWTKPLEPGFYVDRWIRSGRTAIEMPDRVD